MTQAERLARTIHADQRDKAGQFYLGHLERVVAILLRDVPDATPDEIAAAWLHDALEDTPLTEADLLRAGISPAAIATVRALTKPAGADYLDWIRTLARTGSRAALRVKLADNADNSDPARVAALPDGPRRLDERYCPARRLLLAALAEA